MFIVNWDTEQNRFALVDPDRDANKTICYFRKGDTRELRERLQFWVDHGQMDQNVMDTILAYVAAGKRVIPLDWRDLRRIANARADQHYGQANPAASAVQAWTETAVNVAKLGGLCLLFAVGTMLEPLERRLTPWRRFYRAFR